MSWLDMKQHPGEVQLFTCKDGMKVCGKPLWPNDPRSTSTTSMQTGLGRDFTSCIIMLKDLLHIRDNARYFKSSGITELKTLLYKNMTTWA